MNHVALRFFNCSTRFSLGLLHLGMVLVALFSSSCSRSFKDYPRTPSEALKKPTSYGAAAVFEREATRHPGKSGFGLIEGNREAFTSRIALADSAEETLDIQYFIWSADTVGRTIGNHLIKAAERGVRVRFLLDDINFKKRDSSVAALSAHPKIEVRIFNPHSHRSMRMLEFGANFSRLNKRMHNKIMVMDNSVVIVGGRNIADEYFGLSEEYNNRDLDIAAAGPIVREISKTFDEFWNSPAAIPIEALVKKKPTIEDYRKQLTMLRENTDFSRYPFPLEQDVASVRSSLNDIARNMVWAKGEVLYDSFESMKSRELGENVVGQLDRYLDAAEEELLVESAYFVVRNPGVEFAEELNQRGVKLRVLTNSLASNNVIAAQAGHTKRRDELVDANVEVYEFRPDAVAVLSQVAPQGRGSISTLHTKALVIDGEKAFVGSYNLDPRSAEINSEIGIMVYSREFAGKVKDYLDQGVSPENAYRVIRRDNGELQWQTTIRGEEKTWSKEPETSGLKRFVNGFIAILPIEGQL